MAAEQIRQMNRETPTDSIPPDAHRRGATRGLRAAAALLAGGLAAASAGAATPPAAQVQPVMADRWWNPMHLDLALGKSYRFSASGTWRDAGIEADARGYPLPERGYEAFGIRGTRKTLFELSERWRRVPEANWFALICTVGKTTATAFDVGRLLARGGVYIAEHSGPLYCFANDLPLMYWNNHGAITLEVQPLGELAVGPG